MFRQECLLYGVTCPQGIAVHMSTEAHQARAYRRTLLPLGGKDRNFITAFTALRDWDHQYDEQEQEANDGTLQLRALQGAASHD